MFILGYFRGYNEDAYKEYIEKCKIISGRSSIASDMSIHGLDLVDAFLGGVSAKEAVGDYHRLLAKDIYDDKVV